MAKKNSPGCTCCETCKIAEDLFDTGSSLSADWSVRSGTWTVGSGSASTSSTSALAIHNTAAMTLTDGVSVSAQVVPDTGVKPRLIVDYVDDNNYHFAEFGATTTSIYKRASGSNSLIISGSLTPGGSNWFPRLCLNGDSISARFDSGSLAIGSTTTPHNGLKAGIGRDSTAGNASFGVFNFDKLKSETRPTCPTCAVCNQCDGSTPSMMKVVIAGFTNPSCTFLNGTYFLPFLYAASGFGDSCEWCLKLSGSWWIGVYLSTGGAIFAGFRSGSPCSAGTYDYRWTSGSLSYPDDCFTLNNTQLATHSGSSPCGGPPFSGDTGTCHVTAIV